MFLDFLSYAPSTVLFLASRHHSRLWSGHYSSKGKKSRSTAVSAHLVGGVDKGKNGRRKPRLKSVQHFLRDCARWEPKSPIRCIYKTTNEMSVWRGKGGGGWTYHTCISEPTFLPFGADPVEGPLGPVNSGRRHHRKWSNCSRSAHGDHVLTDYSSGAVNQTISHICNEYSRNYTGSIFSKE